MDMVIHDGKLMPATQAWVEMMQEFPQHGYTEETIRSILDRAVVATRELLHRIAPLPKDQRDTQIEWALRADAKAAERWRSQWQGYKPKVQLETVAERLARYHRDTALQEQLRCREIRDQIEKRVQEPELTRKQQAAKAHHHAQVVRGIKARRERKPPKPVYHYAYEYAEPVLLRGGTFQSMLILLSDHHYIELMFEYYAKGMDGPDDCR